METDTAMPALPDDVLASVLGRLPARSLAVSRCVCQAWRGLVDERRLLLPHLLPHSMRGIFANYIDYFRAHFFARPASSTTATSPRIHGEFSYVAPDNYWRGDFKVEDHCNGLVLYRDYDHSADLYVCNPMTRWWVHLPYLNGMRGGMPRAFLVFDPAVSLHYKVLISPLDLGREYRRPPAENMVEWPPSQWTWHVFSSRTGQWRERVFVREGEAAGTVTDLLRIMETVCYITDSPWRYAVYWEGALYVHSHSEYVSRLSLADWKYRVIESPIDRTEWYNKVRTYLGRSKDDVYFAAICKCRLRVWTLNEWHGRTEWVLKHDRVLKPEDWWSVVVKSCYQQIQREGPWILDEFYDKGKGGNGVDWSSDDDDIISTSTYDWKENENDEYAYPDQFRFLGFHPYKEVIFLTTISVAVAYHLNTSKVQFLGILKPSTHNHGVYDSFVYTPCHSLRHRHFRQATSSSCS
ncbi:unnamed protein product [Urochloa humidicola]